VSRDVPNPFWERRGSPDQDAQRLLVISYHFPPDTTIGSRRWEKLTHAVTERGWGVDVITHAPDAEFGSALESLPPGVRVFGVPNPPLLSEKIEHILWRMYRAVRPHRRVDEASVRTGAFRRYALRPRPESIDRANIRPSIRTPRQLLRTYWAWVDFTRGYRWARRAARLAQQFIRPDMYTAVITSAPPHMTHEAGRIVSIATGLPFVMDMRDPWSEQPWLPESLASPTWYRRADRFERGCVDRAALVIANTDPARVALTARYPEASSRIITVMNGADDDALPLHRDVGRFSIRYAGTIYLDRDPQLLFRAAAKVIAAEGLTPEQFGIGIVGRFAEEERFPMLGMAVQEGIGAFVRVEPPRPHAEALQFLAGATMLVVFPGNNLLAIPAKVFEYIRFDSWLLAIAQPASGIAQLLRDTTADVVEPSVDAVAAAIARRYREYASGGRPTSVACDDRFSRKTQARILLDAVARLGRDPVGKG